MCDESFKYFVSVFKPTSACSNFKILVLSVSFANLSSSQNCAFQVSGQLRQSCCNTILYSGTRNRGFQGDSFIGDNHSKCLCHFRSLHEFSERDVQLIKEKD